MDKRFSKGCKGTSVNHSYTYNFFPPRKFHEGYERWCWIQEREEAWEGENCNRFVFFFFFFWCMVATHVVLALFSFNILFCLSHCSPESPGKWSLCKRRLWNCCEILHRGFICTAGHAALVHQSSTGDFPVFFLIFLKSNQTKSLIWLL